MSARRIGYCAATATLLLVAGCHHRAPVQAVAPPPPPPVATGPVMVSVPPPSHRSSDVPDAIPTASSIPVVKAVHPPKKAPRRTRTAPPLVATSVPPPTTPPAAPPPSAAATPATASKGLGQLTTSTDDPTVTRDGAAQAMRRERDRINAIPSPVQAAHATEIDQARRFLKSASDSWNSSDYAATIALTTKARVLLDDLQK